MRRVAGVLAWIAVVAGVGCADSRVDFVSYKDPYFPERFPIWFDDVRYWTASDGSTELVGRTNGKATAGHPAHYLTVRVYWTPRPGRTFADATATDATVRYVLARGGENLTYTGTGFVFLDERLDGKLQVRIESARLRFQPGVRDTEDIFGEMRVSGMLLASHDPGGGSNLVRESQLHAAR